jgi:hypothetical protein
MGRNSADVGVWDAKVIWRSAKGALHSAKIIWWSAKVDLQCAHGILHPAKVGLQNAKSFWKTAEIMCTVAEGMMEAREADRKIGNQIKGPRSPSLPDSKGSLESSLSY